MSHGAEDLAAPPRGSRLRELGPTGLTECARADVATAALLAWVVLPDRHAAVLAGFGVATIALGIFEGYAATCLAPPHRLPGLVRSLGPVLGGAILVLVASNESVYRLATAIGVLLAVRGVGDLLAARKIGRDERVQPWLVGLGLGELASGAVTLALPDLFGQFAVALVGLTWMAGAVLTLLAPPSRAVREVTIAPYLERGLMPDSERTRIDAELAEMSSARLSRFLVLLSASAVIATFGVLTDSVAAVIGAMIVAPLMDPIQGLTAALVAAHTRRMATNALLLLAGIAAVYLVSMLVATTSLDLSFDLTNASVLARTSPTLADLAIALAAGAVGSFALIRSDVSASLPGVAVAVSLVPPLCVSGVTLAGGTPHEAFGAFLLFAVNFVAITAAGGAVLVLAGYGTATRVTGRRLLVTGGSVALVLGLLAVPLATTGRDIVSERTLESATRTQFVDWSRPIEPARLLDVQVEGSRVTLLVASAQAPPPAAGLASSIEDVVGHDVAVEVQWVQALPQ